MPLPGKPNVKKLKAKGDVSGLILALSYDGGLRNRKNWDVRYDARAALVEIGKPAVDALIVAFQGSVFEVKDDTANILGEIGDVRAVEPLIAALNMPWGRNAVVRALGQIGDARAVERLIPLLDTDAKREAAEALGRIGDGRAVEPLIEALGTAVSVEEHSSGVKVVFETALRSMLENTGSNLGSTELTRLAELNVGYSVLAPSRGDDDYDFYEVIDCSRINQLARERMLREGEAIFSVLSLPGLVVYPQSVMALTVELPGDMLLVDHAVSFQDKKIVMVASKNPNMESPGPDDLYKIGTLATILDRRFNPGMTHLLVQGQVRIEIVETISLDPYLPYLKAKVRSCPETVESSADVGDLMQHVVDLFTEWATPESDIPYEMVESVANTVDPFLFVSIVARYIRIDLTEAQNLLELDSITSKLHRLEKILDELLADSKTGMTSSV